MVSICFDEGTPVPVAAPVELPPQAPIEPPVVPKEQIVVKIDPKEE